MIFDTTLITGDVLDNTITVTSFQRYSLNGHTIIGGIPFPVYPTNGLATNNLLPGLYSAQIEGIAGAFTFTVSQPDSTNLAYVTDPGIYVEGISFFNATNLYACLQYNMNAVATNGIKLTTNAFGTLFTMGIDPNASQTFAGLEVTGFTPATFDFGILATNATIYAGELGFTINDQFTGAPILNIPTYASSEPATLNDNLTVASNITAASFTGSASNLTGYNEIGPTNFTLATSNTLRSFTLSIGVNDTNNATTVSNGLVTYVSPTVTTVAAATSMNTPSTIVKRDSSGNFSANAIQLAGVGSDPVTIGGGNIHFSNSGSKILLTTGGTVSDDGGAGVLLSNNVTWTGTAHGALANYPTNYGSVQTNVTFHGQFFKTNAATGNYVLEDQGAVIGTNAQTGAYFDLTNGAAYFSGTVTGATFYGSASGLSQINSNSLDAPTKAQLALAGAGGIVTSGGNGTNLNLWASSAGSTPLSIVTTNWPSVGGIRNISLVNSNIEGTTVNFFYVTVPEGGYDDDVFRFGINMGPGGVDKPNVGGGIGIGMEKNYVTVAGHQCFEFHCPSAYLNSGAEVRATSIYIDKTNGYSGHLYGGDSFTWFNGIFQTNGADLSMNSNSAVFGVPIVASTTSNAPQFSVGAQMGIITGTTNVPATLVLESANTAGIGTTVSLSAYGNTSGGIPTGALNIKAGAFVLGSPSAGTNYLYLNSWNANGGPMLQFDNNGPTQIGFGTTSDGSDNRFSFGNVRNATDKWPWPPYNGNYPTLDIRGTNNVWTSEVVSNNLTVGGVIQMSTNAPYIAPTTGNWVLWVSNGFEYHISAHATNCLNPSSPLN